jgi:hypothetical protein
MKVNRLRIKGSGTGLEQKLSEIPEDLKKLIQANQDMLDISELVRKYYDAKVRDEWHSFGGSHYGLTSNCDIEVIPYFDDKIVGTYTSGYTKNSNESLKEDSLDPYGISPNGDGSYILHKSYESGDFIDKEILFDNEIDFNIKNLELYFDYEGYATEYYIFPEKLLTQILYEEESCVDTNGNEMHGERSLYDNVSSTGKGIEVEICIDGEIVFSEG